MYVERIVFEPVDQSNLQVQHWHACQQYVKSFPSHKAHRAAMISVSLPLRKTPVYSARPRVRGVAVYVPAFVATHCAYPRRDGQAELTWEAAYIPRWFTRLPTVTHPSTNRARRWLTSLMQPPTLPSEPNCYHVTMPTDWHFSQAQQQCEQADRQNVPTMHEVLTKC